MHTEILEVFKQREVLRNAPLLTALFMWLCFFNCYRLFFPGHDGIIRGLMGGGWQRLVSDLLIMQELYALLGIRKRERSTALESLG